ACPTSERQADVQPHKSRRRADTHAGARAPQQAIPTDVADPRIDTAGIDEPHTRHPSPDRESRLAIQHDQPVTTRDAEDRIDVADRALAIPADARRAACRETLGADQVLAAEPAAQPELRPAGEDDVADSAIGRLLRVVLGKLEVRAHP